MVKFIFGRIQASSKSYILGSVVDPRRESLTGGVVAGKMARQRMPLLAIATGLVSLILGAEPVSPAFSSSHTLPHLLALSIFPEAFSSSASTASVSFCVTDSASSQVQLPAATQMRLALALPCLTWNGET